MKSLLFFLLYLLPDALICGCPGSQGVEGWVYMVSGNRMPSPKETSVRPKGVRSTVYIFELTAAGDAVRQGGSAWFSSLKTHLVRRVDTDSLGHFTACLPPGSYSLLIRKGELYFAGWFDQYNHLAPVTVDKGRMTHADCHIEGARPALY